MNFTTLICDQLTCKNIYNKRKRIICNKTIARCQTIRCNKVNVDATQHCGLFYCDIILCNEIVVGEKCNEKIIGKCYEINGTLRCNEKCDETLYGTLQCREVCANTILK